MKANELMIGDWVACRKWIEKPFKLIVLSERKGDFFYGRTAENSVVGPFFVESLEPIPITPEILEKNGFEKRNNYQWEYRDEYCKIVISIAPQIEIDGEILGTPPLNIKIEGALFDISITDDYYVHELQHCLKLVGIDKTIEL